MSTHFNMPSCPSRRSDELSEALFEQLQRVAALHTLPFNQLDYLSAPEEDEARCGRFVPPPKSRTKRIMSKCNQLLSLNLTEVIERDLQRRDDRRWDDIVESAMECKRAIATSYSAAMLYGPSAAAGPAKPPMPPPLLEKFSEEPSGAPVLPQLQTDPEKLEMSALERETCPLEKMPTAAQATSAVGLSPLSAGPMTLRSDATTAVSTEAPSPQSPQSLLFGDGPQPTLPPGGPHQLLWGKPLRRWRKYNHNPDLSQSRWTFELAWREPGQSQAAGWVDVAPDEIPEGEECACVPWKGKMQLLLK